MKISFMLGTDQAKHVACSKIPLPTIYSCFFQSCEGYKFIQTPTGFVTWKFIIYAEKNHGIEKANKTQINPSLYRCLYWSAVSRAPRRARLLPPVLAVGAQGGGNIMPV